MTDNAADKNVDNKNDYFSDWGGTGWLCNTCKQWQYRQVWIVFNQYYFLSIDRQTDRMLLLAK